MSRGRDGHSAAEAISDSPAAALPEGRGLPPGELWGQSAVYLIGRALPAAIGFVAIAVYTRLLSTAEYGLYAVVVSTALLVFNAALLWLCVAAVRLFQATSNPTALRAHLAMLYLLVLGVVAALTAAGYFLFGEPGHRLLFIVGFALFAAHGWLELNLHLLTAEFRAGGYARLAITRSLAATALGAALGYAGLGVAGVLLGTMVGTLIPGLWLLRSYRRPALARGIDPSILRESAAYGLPLAFGFTLEGLLQRADRLLLAILAGTAQAGIYAVTADLADRLLKAFLQPIGSAALPLAARAFERDGTEAARAQLRANVTLLTALALPATVGLALVGPELTAVALGEDFRAGAAALVPVVAAATLAAVLRANYVDHAFHLGRRTGRCGLVALITAASSLAFNVVLIPTLGARGAAYAALGAQSLGLIVGFTLARSVVSLPLPVGELARVALAVAVMAAVLVALPESESAPVLALRVVIGAATYGVSAFVLDVANVRTWLRARHRQARSKGIGSAG